MGCFWGAERIFWQIPGVYSTAVGYAGGITPNPTYEETCSGRTGHTEAVQVVYDPAKVSYETLLKAFWENHDPTQGMRQGNDVGTAVPVRDLHHHATSSRRSPTRRATAFAAGGDRGRATATITTRDRRPAPFYYAEDYHQQYLSDAKNPQRMVWYWAERPDVPRGRH